MGSPLALISRSYAERAWQAYRDWSSVTNGGVNVIHGEATRVNIKNKVITYDPQTTETTDAGKELLYDYLIVATGLGRTWPVAPVRPTKHEYLVDAKGYARELEQTDGPIIIVGGGMFFQYNSSIQSGN